LVTTFSLQNVSQSSNNIFVLQITNDSHTSNSVYTYNFTFYKCDRVSLCVTCYSLFLKDTK